MDVLRTHLGAALGDVAVAETALLARQLAAIEDVFRMHLEGRDAHEEAWSVEAIGEAVRAVDVADVLAQEALDALAELVEAIDILLRDPPRRAVIRRSRERGDRAVHLVVSRDVGDEILDERERFERMHRDRAR